VKRLIVLVLVVCAAVWGFRWWDARPAPVPPEIVWTRQPFRGPDAFEEAGKSPPIGYQLGALSPEPLLEAPQTVPDQRVFLRRPSTWSVRVAEYLDWRKPFTTIDRMSPADLKAWNVHYYSFTGQMTQIGPRAWAEYRRDDSPPVSAR
jgi:hypothetical protein